MMTDNEKRFPKKYRFTLVNRVNDAVLDVMESIADANELDLADPREFQERQYLQKKALTRCKTALFYIELFLKRGLISAIQCDIWKNYVMNVKNMTARWKKQDHERAAKAANERERLASAQQRKY